MANRSAASNFGLYYYGATAIVLGLIGLGWGDFATGWQRVGPTVPFRTGLAYIAAVLEVAGGAALLWRRTARNGAVLLTMLYSIFTLVWVPKILQDVKVFDPWGNFFEELSLVIGGLVLCAALAPRDSALAGKEAQISRSYGICVVSFAMGHITNLPAVASFIPKWIPPQMFWAVTTTVCFVLAAVAILSGILAPLASRLLAVMITAFEILVWMPRLLARPHSHFEWAGNGICLVLAGAAWVVADSIAANARREATYALADSEVTSPA
jgi:uncharacterized membrane protein